VCSTNLRGNRRGLGLGLGFASRRIEGGSWAGGLTLECDGLGALGVQVIASPCILFIRDGEKLPDHTCTIKCPHPVRNQDFSERNTSSNMAGICSHPWDAMILSHAVLNTNAIKLVPAGMKIPKHGSLEFKQSMTSSLGSSSLWLPKFR